MLLTFFTNGICGDVNKRLYILTFDFEEVGSVIIKKRIDLI